MRKRRTRRKILAASVGLFFGIPLMVLAQNDSSSAKEGLVCPLSESQTQNSIEAFAKMVPTFTTEPRCVNCHGAVDPYDPDTDHAGGVMKKQTQCAECHGAFTGWDIPLKPGFFVNRDAVTLCKQMKRFFQHGTNFVLHILNDEPPFNEVAFAGTRGLNERGQEMVPNYRPIKPVGISHEQLVKEAQDWVDAMGGEFKGDQHCGCEPLHYAIRVQYAATGNVGNVAQTLTKIEPVEVPIKFADDGTFTGQGQVRISGAGTAQAMSLRCKEEDAGSMAVKTTGEAIEEFHRNSMRVDLTNVSPATGTTSVRCNAPPPFSSGNFPKRGGNQVDVTFSFEGRVGETQVMPFPLPTPLVKATLAVGIVKQESQPTSPH